VCIEVEIVVRKINMKKITVLEKEGRKEGR